ncbi:MAG TPA: pyruvate:ferredoxin (flavodoxin) oxidoreductase [Candidatus Onthovivens sp.]|nr:pyruvate:ferredoxin (flavodoxin) oxidoreductase [Candidatus Onthovivens sp.]
MAEIKKTMLSVDGNTAAALMSYNFTEVAAIFPITPSSPMANYVDIYSSQGKKNFFGSPVKVCELQSEAGASGALHGSLQGGAYGTTYTASQGLLLMIPNIYKWCGELLPAVLHVSARSLATRSLSIFGDHQDVYAIRQTGIAMICSDSVQEVADLSSLAHLVAIDASYPVCHFFDGFRTSHEIQNVEFVADEEWAKIVPWDKVEEFRARALNPHGHSVTRGGAENDDIYFQGREAQNTHLDNVLPVAIKYFEKVSELTGRTYAPFVYSGASDATKVIIAMGSVNETVLEVVEDLTAKGEKVGMIRVHLYRPFSAELLLKSIPTTCKELTVLDRSKEPGSVGEALYQDVSTALKLNNSTLRVIGGRYGLSSKDIQPKHIKSIYDFMLSGKERHNFTVGIIDDVTHLSIPVDEDYEIAHNYTSCLFYGLGSDGTVGANKSSIKIIGDATHQYAQAYFAYDSRKSGGVTRSHLRFGKDPIHSTYYVQHADFISSSLDSYVFKFDMLKNLKKNGTFLLNTDMSDEALIASLPNRVKHQLAKKNARFFVIDANKIALEIGMGRHTNTILQSAFFYLNPQIMSYEEASTWMKKLALKTYGKKGQEIVELNYKAIDSGTQGLREIKIDPTWIDLPHKKTTELTGDDYFDTYVNVMAALDGDDIPVSTFTKFELLDGTMNPNITYHEQRNIADRVPMWNKEHCIQCNQCAFVCPHATIRPFLLTKEEIAAGPDGLSELTKPAVGPSVNGLEFMISVSARNCVGCGLCMKECLANKAAERTGSDKFALKMVEAKTQFKNEKYASYLYKHTEYKSDKFPTTTVKGIGFLMPYMEISGACAGCGETPYYKLLSQLFGSDLLVANATGCSSIYCGSTPLTPFVTDKNNFGPAWANSLFEDNAEYGYGMRLATDYKISLIGSILTAALTRESVEAPLKELITKYLENIKNRDLIKGLVKDLIALIEKSKDSEIKAALKLKDDFIDKSVWVIGGDGWAYDIGYGGLDHVIASEDDINILCLDTEVYSNTGGQSSKSSQAGSIAQFTASGKKNSKKNLALMAMTYGNVYVAQVALGANPIAAIKAFKEAESYNGPSLIICYAPCVNHGIKGGLINSIETEKAAVECGYFTTFRYDPRLVEEGKPGLVLDCKEPDFDKIKDFIMKETRYSQLPKINPEHYEELFAKNIKDSKARWERIKKYGL